MGEIAKATKISRRHIYRLLADTSIEKGQANSYITTN